MSEIPYETLLNYGVLGVMLVWFMTRTESVIKENTKAIADLKEIIISMREIITKLCEGMDKDAGYRSS